ncbi:MAG TPA: hypothetical protein VJ579_04810 [Candidatus Paceibacterota bacterium]|nr:hypothetical protein [Candidatus Paceibacterota bacterium]
MARKLLIGIALVIAAFPWFGFSHSIDTYVTTVLGLFMAAVLLFSKRPKMLPQEKTNALPDAKPSPFVPSMQELPVAHPKEEAFTPVIVAERQSEYVIPSPIETPVRKRARMAQPATPQYEIPAATSTLPYAHPTTPRRVRKNVARVTLSEEAQVQPADVPFQPNTNSFEDSRAETHS